MTPTLRNGAAMAMAAAGLFTTACASSDKASASGRETPSAVTMIECHGINECKGHGACGGPGHSCAGQNSCRGQGWLKLSKEECTQKGGIAKPF